MALYNKAGEILDKLEQQKGTIRSLCLSDDVVDKKRTYALVCESLKYKDALATIIKQSGLLDSEKHRKLLRAGVATVLVYDFLFGRGLQTSGNYKEIIQKHKTRLQAELVRLKIKRKVKDNKELIPEHIRNAIVLPRWVRVNTLVSTVDKVLNRLVEMGYVLDTVSPPSDLKGKVYQRDPHIPELLLLPSNVDLHDNPLLLEGHIIIQDKASCFPAFILNAPKNSVCIDACAAPGNKTSHLSAIMGNTGKIFAFDMDKRRLTILEKMTGRARCKNIKPTLGNFLEVEPTDKRYSNVEYIMLDPSCSGSGIVGRMDHLTEQDPTLLENEAGEARVEALAEFQKKAILHAFTFPNVKKVVYSTCSKYRRENEDVVMAVLKDQDKFGLAEGAFPGWERRGMPLFDGAKHLVRTDPKEDNCIGFFVALFERKTVSMSTKDRGLEAVLPLFGKRPLEAESGEVKAHSGEPAAKKAKKKNKKKKKKKKLSTEARVDELEEDSGID
ncbi:putative 28S rRNA (cytosine-C(5))-methyltransferase [Thoreauomyces humboldtii]|nr:putative 28S rRNA (cytosine-C(5))-methyltransferase [Thoreauomyces humboldtii]